MLRMWFLFILWMFLMGMMFYLMLVTMFLFKRILLMVHWLKIYLMVLLLLVLRHMLLFLTLSLHKQVSVSTCFVVPVLSYPMKIYDKKSLNCMFDLELLKFKADLERIYGWQPHKLVNVNTTSNNVFSNFQNCPITMNVVDRRAILVWWHMWQRRH